MWTLVDALLGLIGNGCQDWEEELDYGAWYP